LCPTKLRVDSSIMIRKSEAPPAKSGRLATLTGFGPKEGERRSRLSGYMVGTRWASISFVAARPGSPSLAAARLESWRSKCVSSGYKNSHGRLSSSVEFGTAGWAAIFESRNRLTREASPEAVGSARREETVRCWLLSSARPDCVQHQLSRRCPHSAAPSPLSLRLKLMPLLFQLPSLVSRHSLPLILCLRPHRPIMPDSPLCLSP
jgi:hypothetical protein